MAMIESHAEAVVIGRAGDQNGFVYDEPMPQPGLLFTSQAHEMQVTAAVKMLVHDAIGSLRMACVSGCCTW